MSRATPVTGVPFDLAEVKLAAPLTRPGTITKSGLIERLSTSAAPFATVVAPAGYGKTTLLSRWAETDARPFAWVALDGQEDDALVFMRYIAAAVHLVEPLPPAVIEALSGPGGSTWSTRVPRLGRALSGLDRPLVLVLDDLHAVASPLSLDVLAALVEYVPAGSQIAVASREAPPLPVGRWRAEGRVQEVGVPDLRLDEREAGSLLEAAGVELSDRAVFELTERTEGWPAGLYLAALSFRAGAPDPTSAEGFAGDDRYVADYFREELLSRLPVSDAEFLMRTSVLDRMCGPLCDAVLQTTGSADMLETLARTNGFVVPLDRRGEWYRYHHLFGELLRNELEHRQPDLVPTLNGRAMDWCIANDLPETAVAYGHAAGETDTVAGLIDELVMPLYYDGRMETLEEWLAWFGDHELVRYPALAVVGAWLRVLTGRPDDAERWLALADGATSAIPLSDGSTTIEPWIATLRAHMMPEGVERALADADLALDQLSTDSDWRANAHLARGVAHALLGATDRATGEIAAAIEKGLATGAAEEVYCGQAMLALLAAKRGAWAEAGECAQAALETVEEAGLDFYGTSALAYVVAARVAIHDARKDEARALLARAHRLRPLLDHGLPWVTVHVGLELTRAHLALGEASAARTILEETEHVLELRPQMGSLVGEADELRDRVAASSGPSGAWAMSLTGAELRLLPYLASHLTFPEIASRLFISRNTAKTEAVAIYRKFGVSSRSEAIERAVQVGLLDSSVLPPQLNFTQAG
jgi:LuxR family transcriptional regulator, maltose regulon positive regulatory protein